MIVRKQHNSYLIICDRCHIIGCEVNNGFTGKFPVPSDWKFINQSALCPKCSNIKFIGVENLPINTLVKKACGCMYRKVKSSLYENNWLMLVQPSEYCVQESGGSHNRPLYFSGWSFDKDFEVIKEKL